MTIHTDMSSTLVGFRNIMETYSLKQEKIGYFSYLAPKASMYSHCEWQNTRDKFSPQISVIKCCNWLKLCIMGEEWLLHIIPSSNWPISITNFQKFTFSPQKFDNFFSFQIFYCFGWLMSVNSDNTHWYVKYNIGFSKYNGNLLAKTGEN